MNCKTKVHFIGVCHDTNSYEWFHDLVHSIELEDTNGLFDFRFHITGSLTLKQVANICAIEADYEAGALSSTDPVTLLNTPTHYGRPMWQKIFHEITRGNEHRRFGVFYCGPDILGCAIKRICFLKSNNSVQFDFFHEKFG